MACRLETGDFACGAGCVLAGVGQLLGGGRQWDQGRQIGRTYPPMLLVVGQRLFFDCGCVHAAEFCGLLQQHLLLASGVGIPLVEETRLAQQCLKILILEQPCRLIWFSFLLGWLFKINITLYQHITGQRAYNLLLLALKHRHFIQGVFLQNLVACLRFAGFFAVQKTLHFGLGFYLLLTLHFLDQNLRVCLQQGFRFRLGLWLIRSAGHRFLLLAGGGRIQNLTALYFLFYKRLTAHLLDARPGSENPCRVFFHAAGAFLFAYCYLVGVDSILSADSLKPGRLILAEVAESALNQRLTRLTGPSHVARVLGGGGWLLAGKLRIMNNLLVIRNQTPMSAAVLFLITF